MAADNFTPRFEIEQTDMTGLTLNGKYFTTEWIVENYRNLNSAQFSAHERVTLSFCGRWLSGVKQFIVSTSGSTGKPKRIALTRAQMTLSAKMTSEALHLQPGDRALVCLSPAHIAGLMMLVRGFVLDLDLTIVEPASNPFESLSADLQKTPPFHFASFVPLQLQTILSVGKSYRDFLNKMKVILVGGAPVSVSLHKQIHKLDAPIYQTFGMTETVSHVALRRLNGTTASESYRALPNVEIGRDERGCLTITSALTRNQTLVTNDLVELTSKNSFIWLGRVDNVINTGGVKVAAEKVEAALAEVLFELTETDREFFVAGLPDETYGQVVAALFEGTPFSPEFQREMLGRLSQKLGKYELPKRIEFVKNFTRTPTGKIDRKANLRL
jgi:O-succinylbenzoic acid--CoA ligase